MMMNNDLARIRAAKRHLLLKRSISVSLLSKVVRTLTQFLAVSLAVGYLGAERYGLWMVIIASLSWISFAEFGLGPGLINALAETYGRNDKKAASEYFSTALFGTSAIAGLLLLIFLLAFPFISWSRILGIDSQSLISEANFSILTCAILFSLKIPLSMVDATYSAYQKAYLAYAWGIVAQIASLVALFILTQMEVGLDLLILGFVGSELLVRFISGIYLVLVLKRYLFPRISLVTKQAVARIYSKGFAFFFQQIAGFIVLQGTLIILSNNQGPAAVTPYSVTWQLFQMASGMWLMFATALWAAFGEAKAVGDWHWIQRTKTRLIAGSLAYSILLAIGIGFMGQYIILVWAGTEAVPDKSLLWLIAGYSVAFTWAVVHAQILNGLDILWPQMIVSLMNAVFALLFTWWLVPRYGTVGMVFGLIVSLILTSGWMLPFILKRNISRFNYAKKKIKKFDERFLSVARD